MASGWAAMPMIPSTATTANTAAPAKRRRHSSWPAMAQRTRTPTTMMASSTGLSARPRVSLPKLTSDAGSRLMISSPTAGTGEPAGATTHVARMAMARPAKPATAPASRAHHRVARATSRSSRLCTSPSCARAGRRTTN